MAGKITQGKVHGEGGAYVGGYWVPLNECKTKFDGSGAYDARARRRGTAPRRRTARTTSW